MCINVGVNSNSEYNVISESALSVYIENVITQLLTKRKEHVILELFILVNNTFFKRKAEIMEFVIDHSDQLLVEM